MIRQVRRPSIPKGRRSATRGQALVEFALLLPLLTILLFGVIQFGFLFGGQIGLINAVREGTRYASTAPISAPSSAVCTQVWNALSRSIPGWTGKTNTVLTYTYQTAADPTLAGHPQTYSAFIQVQVIYKHPLFIPIVGSIIDGIDGSVDNKFRVSDSEQMRVETQPMQSAPSVGGTTTCT